MSLSGTKPSWRICLRTSTACWNGSASHSSRFIAGTASGWPNRIEKKMWPPEVAKLVSAMPFFFSARPRSMYSSNVLGTSLPTLFRSSVFQMHGTIENSVGRLKTLPPQVHDASASG